MISQGLTTEKEVTTVKRFLLVAVALVCALAIAGPASAVVLDSGDLVGIIINGTPSDLASEVIYSNYLIDGYNSSTSGPFACDGNSCDPYDPNFGAFGTLNNVSATGAVEPASPFFPIDLTSTSFEYLYAKFGGYAALFSLDAYTSIEGIDTSGFEPAGVGGGLSHVALLNPTSVPEPGTLMLLGFGLAGMGTFRRFKKL